MTTAPSIPTGQRGLFDAPAAKKTKTCANCGHERSLNQFAWTNKSKTEREKICSTCRFPVDTRGPDARKLPAGIADTDAGPKIRKSRPDALLKAPYLPAIDPQPSACWMKAGDTVQVFLNNELTGQVVIGYLVVISVTNGEKLRKQKKYTVLRNKFIQRGYQLMEMRRSEVAPAIERTAREGRAHGE